MEVLRAMGVTVGALTLAAGIPGSTKIIRVQAPAKLMNQHRIAEQDRESGQ